MTARRSAVGLALCLSVLGCAGEHQGPGTPTDARAPAAEVAAREGRFELDRGAVGGEPEDTQILFGDLHVHTTFSADAYILSLPMMGGEGAHPPADACDYARFCAALDFWSINDHAEGLTPEHWRETKDAIRTCNAVAGGSPDTVAFLGWEWSQVGLTAEDHYGHKNVVFRELDESRVPRRAIAAPRPDFRAAPMPLVARIALPLLYFPERQRYFDYFRYLDEVEATPPCPEGVPASELPDDCHEVARDPAELFERLDAFASDHLVIPHGTSWGLMTPPGTTWDAQLAPGQHDPARQGLLEVYSGHGSSEEYRAWDTAIGASGEPVCAPPSPSHLPCCWRAGEIIRERCADPSSAECERLVEKARRDYVASGIAGHHTVPGATVEDWLDCGQCRDCFLPAFNLRPGMSAQYALARGGFGPNGGPPARLRFGMIGSSDTHGARAGNGFKEGKRRGLTEGRGPSGLAKRFTADGREPVAETEVVRVQDLPLASRRYVERGASYLTTGGLVAVHARARDRDSIFDALRRREVYATSGDRILLAFDLVNGPGDRPVPMGGEVDGFAAEPRFRVRAAGAFEQKPGCPAWVEQALTPDDVERLCLGECYHPGDRRRRITRVEVVRIRPQQSDDEPIASLIDDPWKSLPCPESEAGCSVEFDDPEFPSAGRETLYYVRAVQEPTLAVNGDGLRCEWNEAGECTRVRPCHGDDRTSFDDDCLAEIEERAWSSPIFLAPAG